MILKHYPKPILILSAKNYWTCYWVGQRFDHKNVKFEQIEIK